MKWGNLGLAAVVLMAAASAKADVPRLIHYQGKLVTSAGAIVPGPVDIRARLYDSFTNPTPVLFDETHNAVDLNRGLFSILLGSQTGGGVPDSVFAGSAVYLGISVDAAAELSPRIRIATAPYAAKTRGAEQLVRAGTTDPAAGMDASGRLGIGTLSPDASALVDMSSTSRGLLLPRMSTAERDAIPTPAVGLMLFNTTTGCFNFWTGVTWKQSCFECDFTSPVPSNNGPLCEGSNLQLSATSILGATYQWTGPNGFSSSDQNPMISAATPAATGPYSVSATVNGCTSTPATTLATVNPIPASPTASNNGPLCAGQTLFLTSTSVPGANYSWSGPNGFVSAVQNPTIPNVTTAASGAYTVTAVVSGCAGAASQTTATIGQTPATPGSINGLTTVCANTTGVVYSIADVPGATSYAWTVPAGASIVAGQGTAFATVNFGGQSGDVTVTASNFCGTSAASTQAVTVNNPAGGSQNFTYNGSSQSFTVPACVTSLVLQVWGAQGTSGGGLAPGRGGYATGRISPVTPGETLTVYVGGQGGFNGGGSPTGNGGAGGGATDIRRGGTDLSNRIIVAGGGGGSAGDSYGASRGHGGGGTCGSLGGENYCGGGGGSGYNYGGNDGAQNGGNNPGGCPTHGGGGSGGGLQSGGGGACSSSCQAPSGSLGQGGNGCSGCGGAGGGGGYYGGGGSAGTNCGSGQGGGGSSWTGTLTNSSFTAGTQTGNGQATISW